MFYIETDDNGIPARWSSSSFEEATETASFDVDLSTVYFKSGEMLYLPPKPDYPCKWVNESWVKDEDTENTIRKQLCNRIILSVASLEAQTNVNGALAAGELDAADMALAAAFRAWVQAMRQAVADATDFPAEPDGVRDLMNKF